MTFMYTDSHLITSSDLKIFLSNPLIGDIQITGSPGERATWIFDRLIRFKYMSLSKRDKGVVLQYLKKLSGMTSRQLDRHVKAYKSGKRLCEQYKREKFSTKYTTSDIDRYPYNPPHESLLIGGFFWYPEIRKISSCRIKNIDKMKKIHTLYFLIIIYPMPGKFHKIDPAIKAEILRQIKEDFIPTAEVASKYNISTKTIYNWLRSEVGGTGKTDSQYLTEIHKLQRERDELVQIVGAFSIVVERLKKRGRRPI